MSFGPLVEGAWYTFATTTSQTHGRLDVYLVDYNGNPIMLTIHNGQTYHLPWGTILSIRPLNSAEVLSDPRSSGAARQAAMAQDVRR